MFAWVEVQGAGIGGVRGGGKEQGGGRTGNISEVPQNIIINKDTDSRLLALESDLYEQKLLRNYESLTEEFIHPHSVSYSLEVERVLLKKRVFSDMQCMRICFRGSHLINIHIYDGGMLFFGLMDMRTITGVILLHCVSFLFIYLFYFS